LIGIEKCRVFTETGSSHRVFRDLCGQIALERSCQTADIWTGVGSCGIMGASPERGLDAMRTKVSE